MRLRGLMLCLLLLATCSARAAELPDTPPLPLEPRGFTLPPFCEYSLSNGLTVLLVEDHEIPLVWMQLEFAAGDWADPPGQEGLASVAMSMLDRRTQTKNSRTISMKKRRLGAQLSNQSHLDGSTVAVSCLKRNLGETLDLLAEVLQENVVWGGDVASRILGRDEYLREEAPHADWLCRRALKRVAYGDTYAGREPTKESYAQIAVGDITAWIRRNVHPGHTRLLVAGDVTMEEIAPLLEARLADWTAGTPAGKPSPTLLPPETTTLYMMDLPEAVQSVIGISRFVSSRTDDDYLALDLGHVALAGMFSSRINMNLREDKGWTYGTHSSIFDAFGHGRWRLWTAVEADATADALSELLGELRAVRTDRPLTPEEVETARANQIYSWPAKFSDPGVFLGELAAVWRYDLPDDWITSYLARLREVEVDQVNEAVVRHFDPDAVAVVVVGDLSRVREPLEALGFPVVEIDKWGVEVEAE